MMNDNKYYTHNRRPLKASMASFLSLSLSFRYTYYTQILYIDICFKTTFPSVKHNYLSVYISIIIVLLTVVEEDEHLTIFI